MRIFVAVSTALLMLATTAVNAQTKSNNTGQDVNGAPGRTGSGAAVGDKDAYKSDDPSRTGSSGRPTNPKSAGQVGDTGKGK